MQIKSKIAPCLWFDNQAEVAAKFYTSVFKGSKIVKTSHYTEAGREVHGRPPGSVMTVEFELAGQSFTALNGGPLFKFNEAISFQVMCETQDEVDYFWSKLSDGGQEGPCGWLKDKFGVSWQVVPTIMGHLFSDKDPKKAGRAMQAMLKMKKLDIAELKRA
ncbi:MAG TPA: VOC family protein [Tepidisphaeraceae bacterium]|jgi:predicted 3-demethylubiquinone-9 3-methyltransferase (glyoxalase superfamily)|nr:VOC family protein [Tepidisphaeraceae bacterium]